MSKKFKENMKACISEANVLYEKINDFDVRVGLCLLEILFREENVEEKFIRIIKEYPECLKAIPVLLAIRTNEIYCLDEDGLTKYNFDEMNRPPEEYANFMEKTGLFDIFRKTKISDLVSYVIGFEVGMLFAGKNES